MDPLQLLEKDHEASRELEAAAARFRPRTFYEQYRSFRTTAKYARYGLPVISILTGVTSFAVAINQVLPFWWLAFPMGALLLVAWERGKALAVEKATELYLPDHRAPAFLLLLAALLSAGSIAFSLHGTYEASRLLDRTEATNTAIFGAQADSVQSYYAQRIEQAHATAKQYFAANNYQGTITYSRDNRFAKRYESLLAQAVELEAQRDAALAQLDTDRRGALTTAQAHWRRNTWAALALILLVEVCIIAANWFIVFFDYKSQLQVQLVKQHGLARVSLSLDDIASVLQSFVGAGLAPARGLIPAPVATADPQPTPITGTPPPAQIGFALPKKPEEPESRGGAHIPSMTPPNPPVNPPVTPPVNPLVTTTPEAEYLLRYPAVVAALEAGKGIGTTAKECGVSESTVKNVRRVMKAINP